MFDFIKDIFKSSGRRQRARVAAAHQPDELDVLETNNIEVLRTAEFSEGAPAQVMQEFVAEHEIPAPQLDIPALETIEIQVEQEPCALDVELPPVELDEPTDEPAPDEELAEEADNYMTGNLQGTRVLRNIQTREAGVAHWNSSSAKYRPRQKTAASEVSSSKKFEYLEALQTDPQLRQMELENPGMSMECLSLNKFLSDCMKTNVVGEYVDRSIESIHAQSEGELPPLQTVARQRFGGGTSGGVTPAAEHRLRSMFDAYEIQQAELKKAREQQVEPSTTMHEKNQAVDDSYTRWLMTVAEDASESDDVLWLLVQDPNPDVRFCLAENYDINTEILHALSLDENPYVAHRAEKTLNRLAKQGGFVVDHDFSSAAFQQRKSS